MKKNNTTLFLVISTSLYASTERPNILFIVSEDNGPELGCYGDAYAKTPHLDQLAAEGVRFENAFVPYSVCSPSRAAFYTGMYPHQNGQLGLQTHKFRMYKEYPWIGSYLKSIGYHIGLVGKLHVDPSDRFAREWDFRTITGSNFNQSGRNMANYANAAENFFSQAGDKPFFLTINYPDAHFPVWDQAHGLPEVPQTGSEVEPLSWIGVSSTRIKGYMAGYYNCMSRLDSGVGMLIEKLKATGKYDNTLIVYIGDHGAQFSRGKTSCYDAAIRVPLIVTWKGKVLPRVVTDELVSTIDILPTILQATGIEVPEYLPGKPLQPLLQGHTGGHDLIASFTSGSAPSILCVQNAFRTKRWKLVHTIDYSVENRSARGYLNGSGHFEAGCSEAEIATAPQYIQDAYDLYLNPPDFELYDMKNDRDEFINLAENPDYADVLAEMKQKMNDWQVKYNDPFRDPAMGQQFVDEQILYVDNSGHKTSGFRWEYVDIFTPYGPDTTSGEKIINYKADFSAKYLNCGFEVSDGFSDGSGSIPTGDAPFATDLNQNYTTDVGGHRWFSNPLLKAHNANMLTAGVSGYLTLGSNAYLRVELDMQEVPASKGIFRYGARLGNAFTDGATWTLQGFNGQTQSWEDLHQKTILDTNQYHFSVSLTDISLYSKYQFLVADTPQPKSLHLDSISLSEGISEPFDELQDGSDIAQLLATSAIDNPVPFTLNGANYVAGGCTAFNAKDHSGPAPNVMLNASTYVGTLDDVPTSEDDGTYSFFSWEVDSSRQLDSVSFGIRSNTKSKLINHAVQSFKDGVWTTLPGATWSQKDSANPAYSKKFTGLSLQGCSKIRIITWAATDADLGVAASIDNIEVGYRNLIDPEQLVGSIHRVGHLVTWSLKNDEYIQSFQLVNSETGEVIDTVITRGIDGMFSAEVDEEIPVRLEIVDINQTTHNYQPVVVSNETSLPLSIASGWNLLAVLGRATNSSDLLNVTESNHFWVWSHSSYILQNNLPEEGGFWVQSRYDDDVTLSVLPNDTEVSLEVGWNLIGPTEDNRDLPQEVDVAFYWQDGRYHTQSLDAPMELGRGYWVYSNAGSAVEF